MNRARFCRELRGHTVEEAAKRIGVLKMDIELIENRPAAAIHAIPKRELAKIAKHYKTPLADLIKPVSTGTLAEVGMKDEP